MKKLLWILVLSLFLITPSQANDIRDFQIEGMSIGDSALDYFSKEEINSNKTLIYERDFDKVEIRNNNFKTYELIGFYLKKNDKRYEIFGITGAIFVSKGLKECLPKKKKIEKEISLIFKNLKKFDHGTSSPSFDKKTKYNQVTFTFENNDTAVITCYDWSKKIERENNWGDNLAVELLSKEVAKFIRKITRSKKQKFTVN